jgi:thiol-disulfide isomerase/thioredoxin
MRLFLTILLINCFVCSYGQTPGQPVDSAAIFYADLFNYIKENQESKVPDSVKQENLFNEVGSIISRHPKEASNFTLIAQCFNLTYRQVQTLISLVDTAAYGSPWKAMADNVLKRISVAETGKPFPPLILSDTTGEELSIASLKGKIVYIDVWSSWCGPCREEIPEIKKIYKKYNSRGLEIIGISIDDDKEKWLKAIKEDKQTWKSYCELKHWQNNKLAKRFSIYSIPANFLIDENGILVGQNLDPESLRAWLVQHK